MVFYLEEDKVQFKYIGEKKLPREGKTYIREIFCLFSLSVLWTLTTFKTDIEGMDDFEKEHNGISKSSKLHFNPLHFRLYFYFHVVNFQLHLDKKRYKEKILFLEVKLVVIFSPKFEKGNLHLKGVNFQSWMIMDFARIEKKMKSVLIIYYSSCLKLYLPPSSESLLCYKEMGFLVPG